MFRSDFLLKCAIGAKMCNWSLNNEVILLSILSGIVILIFPPPPAQNCDVCCISMAFKKTFFFKNA